jgi:5-(aminomethyl)-3-furanmethanol phosphate kinase
MPAPVAVVKVGGSLYDWSDLGRRLRDWLRAHCAEVRVLLVPGGGPLVDVIRDLDRRHALGEECCHWLALRVLSLNAHWLATLLPSACVVADVAECRRAWEQHQLPILDVHEFARTDEQNADHLPHSWRVTSDSLAARVAVVLRARLLVLLKSTTIPAGIGWEEAGRLGLVDEMRDTVLRTTHAALQVRAVNVRK